MFTFKLFVILPALIFCVEGSTLYNGRIIGGEDVEEGELPYQIQLQLNGRFRCGGTILNENFILTAAHCIALPPVDPSQYTVVAGTLTPSKPSGVKRRGKNVIVHEKWSWDTIHNDIALIQLSEPLVFGEYVQPIALPTEDTEEGTELILSGWGQTTNPGNSAETLQKLSMDVSNLAECNETIIAQDHLTLTDKQICAFAKKGNGGCYGDSGGPLALSGKYIVGIVSMNIKDCALGNPDVFTRVYKYLDWIQEHIGNV